MPAKKQYPKNKILPVAVAEIELDALRREAGDREMSVSDLAHEKLRAGTLLATVARYFPEDAPKLAHEYSENGAHYE